MAGTARGTFRRAWVGLGAAALAAVGLAACRGGRDGGGNADPVVGLTVSGSLGAGYALPGFAGTATTVDQVWAVRLGFDGEASPDSIAGRQEFDIGEDGSFELALDADGDYVLLLVDSTAADKKDRIKAYVSIQDVDGSLMQIPAGDSGEGDSGGDHEGDEGGGDHEEGEGDSPHEDEGDGEGGHLDLGECNEDGDEAVSTETLQDSADAFSLTLDQLQEIARTDDVLKVLKNVYVNYDEETDTYLEIWPFFGWQDTAGEIAIGNVFSDPAVTVADHNNGFSYYFNTNSAAYDFDTLCDQTQAYTLNPPAQVEQVDGQAGPWTFADPWTNQGTSWNTGSSACGVGEMYASEESGDFGGTSLTFNYAGGTFWKIPIVEGWWQLQVDGTKVFEFDGRLGSPFEENDPAKPVVYIPSLKAVVTTGAISSFEMKWYLRNDGGTYDEVTDLEMLDRSTASVVVSLTDYSGTSGNGGLRIEENATMNGLTAATPPSGWRFLGDGSTTSKVAEEITITYEQRGIRFRFEWR